MSSFVNGIVADIIEHVKYPLDYYSYRLLTTTLGGDYIRYYSKPGIPDWDVILPAHHLLIEHSKPVPMDHVWCINCGPGALAAAISKNVSLGTCLVSTNDILTATSTRLTQSASDLHNLTLSSDTPTTPQEGESIDLILMGISKSRDLNRYWLFLAYQSLKPGGRLLIAGANTQGIQSVIKDSGELFNNLAILAYKKGNRVAQFSKMITKNHQLPEWTREPGIAPGTWNSVDIPLSGMTMNLVSLPGVFSSGSLDGGTQLLLSTLADFSGEKVIDVGCGYGVIGIFAATHGAASVDLIDSQFFSIKSCHENIRRCQLSNSKAYCSDLFSAVRDKSYTCVLSNPPFHSGYQVDYQIAHALIRDAHLLLETNGYLQLVANRFIRYARMMAEIFGNVAVIADNSSYHVLVSRKV